jgi:lysophospholipase L1-like esterase
MRAIRICFVGDSLTAGTGDPEMLGWPGRLARRAAQGGHEVTPYNLGIRADTSRLIAARWRAECEARLPDAFAGRLVFAFGVNDTAQEADGTLRVAPDDSLALARAIVAEARGWKPLLWVGPLPVDEAAMPIAIPGSPPRDFRNARIAELSARYAALADELGVPYLDLYRRLAGDARWPRLVAAGDGVHPGAAGYELVADAIGAWRAWQAWFDA